MIKGLYTGASAMLANKENMKITTNNLANANTNGFKKQGVVQKTFSEMLLTKIEQGENTKKIGSLGTGVSLFDSYTNFSAGDYDYTGAKFDLSLQGKGFFVIETPDGKRYTRNGNFTLDKEGKIVTQEGYPLLDEENKHILTLPEKDFAVDGYGQLYFGKLKGSKIKVVDFNDYNQLEKAGDNYYSVTGDVKRLTKIVDDCCILEGYLEKSNVNIVKEMVNMIEVTRLYESNQKVVQSIDNTLEKAVNEVGRIV